MNIFKSKIVVFIAKKIKMVGINFLVYYSTLEANNSANDLE